MNGQGNSNLKRENGLLTNNQDLQGQDQNAVRFNFNEHIRRYFANTPILKNTHELDQWLDNIVSKLNRMMHTEAENRLVIKCCRNRELGAIWSGHDTLPLPRAIELFRKLGTPKSKRELVFQHMIQVAQESHPSLYSKYSRISAAMNSRAEFAGGHVYHMNSVNDWFFSHINEKQREFLREHEVNEDAAHQTMTAALDKYGSRLQKIESKVEHTINYANGRNNSQDDRRHTGNYTQNQRYNSKERRQSPYNSRPTSREGRTTYNGNRSPSPFKNNNSNSYKNENKSNTKAITELRNITNNQQGQLDNIQKMLEKLSEQMNTLQNREINDPRRVSFEQALKDIDGTNPGRHNYDLYTIKEQEEPYGSKRIMKIKVTINDTPMT
ncbi:hypothetical protein SNEBB_001748 [Seison nebaliae]|nr:hypothetical protein SNEBB_001748 [Seison nebaliae]